MILAAVLSIVLTESLNHRWSNELVTYPVTGQVTQVTGPTGPIPAQTSGPFVSFVVSELAPLSTNVYTVTAGTSPSDLAITNNEATSSRYGIRFLLGEQTYDPPIASSKVPGPVLGMRLADGTWFGGSRLYGETPVASYTARLTDAGPVFARVECRYVYVGGRTNTVTIQLNSQANHAEFSTRVSSTSLTDGWELLLNGLPPLAFQFEPEQGTQQPGTQLIGAWKERPIAMYAPGLISKLTPWGDWADEFTQTKLHLAFIDNRPVTPTPKLGEETPPQLDTPKKAETDGRELFIRRMDAGAWVTPGSGVSPSQASVPLMKADDGTLFLRFSNKVGDRLWWIGENPSYRAKLARAFRPNCTMQDELEPLNVVKDMILDWPTTAPKHPRLFLDADDFAKAGARNPAALQRLQDIQTLRADLGSYVYFDTMRRSAGVICLYDALIDTVPPADQKLLRAQMAYLAYRLASPSNWSISRGYASGNPNMTVAHLLNQGLAACVLPDHPLAKEWSAEPVKLMDAWLSRLDAAGHWPESSHYARVSESKMVYFAIATQRAGLGDFLNDPRFKRMVMYYEKLLTPPDPQRKMSTTGKTPRVTPPYGRGVNGECLGIGGIVAKATANLDPAYSRQLQWSFAGSHFCAQFGEEMFGYDQLLTDPTLPTERPDWRSEMLPSLGALFRSGVGTPEENYLLLVSKYATNPDGEIWAPEVGAITRWFDRGQPITQVFPAGSSPGYLHGLMLNRVMLATGKKGPGGYAGDEKLTGFATLPHLDYIGERYNWKQPSYNTPPPTAVPDFPEVEREGKLPATWHRQALYTRDYLVLRDTLTGNQPTQWQFWSLTKGLQPVDGKRIPVDETLTMLTGNQFTAKGQFNRDLDYFVASPADTLRHTLRHGFDAPQYAVLRGFRCEQDLLHLQLPGDGTYFVALVPHAPGESPAFTKLTDTVMKIGNDLIFLADSNTTATAGDASFTGTVGNVQAGTNLVLALGAEGSITYKAHGLAASLPASLQVEPKTLIINLSAQHPATEVTVTAPGKWTADRSITLVKSKDKYQVSIPVDVTEVRLTTK